MSFSICGHTGTEISGRDMKISGCHTKGYSCLMDAKVQSPYCLNPKFQVSSRLLLLYGLCRTWSETPKTDFLGAMLKRIWLFSGGYYTLKTPHGIRIVALNTNLYYTSNKQVDNETDPADQLYWLNQTLSQAMRNHEKVTKVIKQFQ